MSKQSEMSQRILDAISMNPDNFDMQYWIQEGILFPDEECGTTLCVAGWGAHLDGWKLESGFFYQASKGGKYTSIARAGLIALDIAWDEGDDLFHTDDKTALACLKRMANGERYTQQMIREEREVTRRESKEENDDDESTL